MKIRNVSAVMLSYLIPPKNRVKTDLGTRVKADTTVIVVETDEGITGYGCAQGNPPIIKSIVDNQLRNDLVGEDPTFVERLWEKMYSGSRSQMALRTGISKPILGRRGETICAISGVDIALWDILGKSMDQPIYKILGASRDNIRSYINCGYGSPREIKEEVARYMSEGFRGVKIVAYGNHGFSISDCEKRVSAVRETLGIDGDVMIDAHGFLDVPTAANLSRRLEPYGLSWFEEPVSPDDLVGMAQLRAVAPMAIAAGESEFTRFGFRDMIEAKAVDIVQPDVGISGGITECRRIAAVASTYGIQFSPHGGSPALMVAASLHLAGSIPNCNWFSVSPGRNPLTYELAQNPPLIKEGYAYVPSGPGLGVSLAPDFEKMFPYIDGPAYEP